MEPIRFFVGMRPKTKGNSMEIRKRGRRRWIGPDNATKAAQTELRVRAMTHGPRDPWEGDVRLDVDVVFEPPPSWDDDLRAAALRGELDAPGRNYGDRGNHLKLVEDALEGVIYVDDAQICEGDVRKRWGEREGYLITARQLRPGSAQAKLASA